MKLKSLLVASTCLFSIFVSSGCMLAPQTEAVSVISDAEPLALNLKTGQVIQFALFKAKEGDAAQDIRERYFRTAIPDAQSFGNESLGSLKIKQTLLGKNQPRGIAIYTFPNEEAQKQFQSTPNLSDYKRMRKDGWDELHVFSAIIPYDMQLKFDPAKDYTLAAAWTRPDTMPDYQRYLDGIETDFDEIGARYIAQLNDIDLQSQTDEGVGPSQLTIVEWSKGPNLKALQSTDAYKAHAKDFSKAISRFDLYWITTNQ